MGRRAERRLGDVLMKGRLRFLDWPLRAKMAALLLVASLLPLAIGAVIDIREGRQRLIANTSALLAARGDQLVGELDAFLRGYQRAAPNIRAAAGGDRAVPRDAH